MRSRRRCDRLESLLGNSRILVVAPHPDDEVIGCGGTLLRARDFAATVGVLWVSSPTDHREAEDAAAALGAEWTTDLGYAHIGLEYGRRPLDKFIGAYREFKPDVLFVPSRFETDDQHLVTRRIALEAEWACAYALPDDTLSEPIAERPWLVLGYEVWTPIPEPSLLVDVEASFSGKLTALEAYRSQLAIREYREATSGLARYRGAMNGGVVMEAFCVEACRS